MLGASRLNQTQVWRFAALSQMPVGSFRSDELIELYNSCAPIQSRDLR